MILKALLCEHAMLSYERRYVQDLVLAMAQEKGTDRRTRRVIYTPLFLEGIGCEISGIALTHINAQQPCVAQWDAHLAPYGLKDPTCTCNW